MKRDRKLHIWPETFRVENNTVVAEATIEAPDFGRKSLWYRLPLEYQYALTRGCEPFLVGLLFTAMRRQTDMVVHGEISPTLLDNLEEYQSAWNAWYPDLYTLIDIQADVESEIPGSNEPSSLTAFTGGLDSAFTVWRHHKGYCGRQQRDLKAGVMIHGYDIPLGQPEVFDRAAYRAKTMLNSLGIPLITISTNLYAFRIDWQDMVNAYAASVVSGLMLLERGYSEGLIAATHSYRRLKFPTTSNPATDRLLSSGTFRIIHDGTAFNRNEKARLLADWPEAFQNMRVCWAGDHLDRNCGRCEKCIRTILNFRVAGLGLPPCFERDVSNFQILRLKYPRQGIINYFTDILSDAKNSGISASWIWALTLSLLMNRFGLKLKGIPEIQAIYQSIEKTLRAIIHPFQK